jgi:hypothetical protein
MAAEVRCGVATLIIPNMMMDPPLQSLQRRRYETTAVVNQRSLRNYAAILVPSTCVLVQIFSSYPFRLCAFK